jgi:hypothetical protein
MIFLIRPASIRRMRKKEAAKGRLLFEQGGEAAHYCKLAAG